MKEYEISVDNKVLGRTKIYNENINKDLSNAFIKSNNGLSYVNIDKDELQTYEILYNVNSTDDLFDIVSKYIYDNELVFKTIEEIKEYNNIKSIKKDTKLKIVVPEIYLTKLNISKSNVDYNSLLNSKVNFIKNALTNNELINTLNNIITEYNNYIKSNEYEFLTEEEKKENINEYLNRLDIIIEYIEKNTKYKYGKDYIVPIKISNN